jgi:hypothetical protein
VFMVAVVMWRQRLFMTVVLYNNLNLGAALCIDQRAVPPFELLRLDNKPSLSVQHRTGGLYFYLPGLQSIRFPVQTESG